MFGMIRDIRRMTTLLGGKNRDEFLDNMAAFPRPTQPHAVIMQIITELFAKSVSENLLHSDKLEQGSLNVSLSINNTFNYIKTSTTFSATVDVSVSNVIASTIISANNGEEFDYHAQKLHFSNVQIDGITHSDTGSKIMDSVLLTKSFDYVYKGLDSNVSIERKMSRFNHIIHEGRKNVLIARLQKDLDLDVKVMDAHLVEVALASIVSTAIPNHMVFNSSDYTINYETAIDPTYDKLKSMDYTTFNDNKSRLKVLMNDGDYSKLTTRMKLLYGGTEEE